MNNGTDSFGKHLSMQLLIRMRIVDMIKTEVWINQSYEPVGEEDEIPELIAISHVLKSLFRIRIHWFRMRVQHF